MVAHAEYNVRNQRAREDGLILPGSITVTYTCKEGYKNKGTQSMAQCVYHRQKRENDPDNELVTTMWDGQQNVICEKGKVVYRYQNYAGASFGRIDIGQSSVPQSL